MIDCLSVYYLSFHLFINLYKFLILSNLYYYLLNILDNVSCSLPCHRYEHMFFIIEFYHLYFSVWLWYTRGIFRCKIIILWIVCTSMLINARWDMKTVLCTLYMKSELMWYKYSTTLMIFHDLGKFTEFADIQYVVDKINL